MFNNQVKDRQGIKIYNYINKEFKKKICLKNIFALKQIIICNAEVKVK